MKTFQIIILLAIFVLCAQYGFAKENMSDLKKYDKATLAGGCFWCIQSVLDKVPGVKRTIVGYTGGDKKKPTYKEVSGGMTGHAEAVEVYYDPIQVTYEKLLDVFWKNIDPTTLNRQFADEGTQYRTAIFYHNDEQQRIAQASKEALAQSGVYKDPIVTEITPASTFYPAEEYHQSYYQKSPLQYKMYEAGSGRKKYIEGMWGPQKK